MFLQFYPHFNLTIHHSKRNLTKSLSLHILGPSCLDIFNNHTFHTPKISDNVIAQSRITKDVILKMLSEPVLRPTNIVRHEVSKRCKAMASFIETLMGETRSPELKLELPEEADLTASERESMDNISPHHDYDSTVSSETVPSYNQLNYNENIHRFFNSRPTTQGNFKDFALDSLLANVTDSPVPEVKIMYDECGGGGIDTSLGGHFSSGSTLMLDSHTGTTSSWDSAGTSARLEASCLTEAHLLRHNDDMEKSLIKKHRVCRNSTSARNGECRSKKPVERKSDLIGLFSQGIKRAIARSWEDDDANKNTKFQHPSESRMFSARLPNGATGGAAGVGTAQTSSGGEIPAGTMHNVIVNSSVPSNNMWPPCLLGTASPVSVQTTQHNQFAASQSTIFPTTVYLLPAPTPTSVPQLTSLPPQVATSVTAATAVPSSQQYMPYMTGLMHPYVLILYKIL